MKERDKIQEDRPRETVRERERERPFQNERGDLVS